ncbi:hypothetical protein GCM10009785_01330 [Brooklawnia cerclae]|uniref:DUF4224 domain-containing protein n=1 Tax=Brooklawnia cerclae TaxID=349934 RepID=A0ABX0SG20_9ACTN|nr:hypothetical protein [Brooklawnia cerclae]NIH56273.1 hypothetical protein [Brooklawnia cerclae]
MSNLVDPARIEEIVGCKRHPTKHIARAISAEQTVYILHPDTCAARLMRRPLTECRYSRSLDVAGILPDRWAAWLDQPVFCEWLDAEGRLVPRGPATEQEGD